jgi:hypothetical protein
MQRAIINALLMTLVVLLLGGAGIWGICINFEALSSESVERRKQGLPTPALPRSWEFWWRASPRLVLSGIYLCSSVVFAAYVVEFSGPKSIYGQSILTKFIWTYEHTAPRELFAGCAIWLILFFAVLFVFVRSAIKILRRSNEVCISANGGH